MKILGVVVEYNPFHHGHAYHLQTSKKKIQPDVTIGVMSGSFLQRGEPALTDKWTRTAMALRQGMDLVVELPYSSAVQKADVFAEGAVALLDELGTTDLCFGSETGEITPFLHTYNFIQENEDKLNLEIQKHLSSGKSYPRIYSEAFSHLSTGEDTVDLTLPNNILGYNYVKSASGTGINVHTVKRKGAGYHDPVPAADSSIASATALRNKLEEGRPLQSLSAYVPASSLELLKSYKQNFGLLHNWSHYYPLLQYKLFCSSPEELQKIYECEEGLEYRLLKYRTAPTFPIFMEKLKTKRYTRTRLQRLCTHILNGVTKNEMKLAAEEAPSIRLLGMNKKGRHYLNRQKKALRVPLLTRAGEAHTTGEKLNVKAADIHSLAVGNSRRKFEYERRIILH